MKVLLIAEYIAPVNAIASIRWTKISKYLVLHHQASIDLLTNEKNFSGKKLLSENYSVDPTLMQDVSNFQKAYLVRDGAKLKIFHGIHNFLRYAKNISSNKWEKDRENRKNSEFVSPKNGSRDTRGILSCIRRSLNQAVDESIYGRACHAIGDCSQYDVVISSYGPRWTHRVAAEIKKKNPSIIWVADYRDSLVYSDATDTEDNRSFAKKTTHNADCVISVSKGVSDLLFLDPLQRREIVTNGFDPDDVLFRKKRHRSNKFEITYTGTLHDEGDARRDLTPLFRALVDLVDGGVVCCDDIVVRYAGGTEGIFFRQASCFPDIPVESVGLVSRDRAMEMQSTASLLIFSNWNTSLQKGGITGKLFEYLTSGVPIVGVSSGDSPNSEAKKIIEKSGAGFCYEEASDLMDYPRLIDFVRESYTQWKNRGLTSCRVDSSYVSKFSYPVIANQVAGILCTLSRSKENTL